MKLRLCITLTALDLLNGCSKAICARGLEGIDQAFLIASVAQADMLTR